MLARHDRSDGHNRSSLDVPTGRDSAARVMAGSGLEILTAYPMLGPSGDLYGWYPWQGWSPPRWLRFGG